jgi:hypothetical protein
MSGADGKTVAIIPLAQKKITQRGIPVTWVEETLNHPEQVVEGYRGRLIAHRRMTMEGKERLLRVVYEETETTRVVVTAYLTSDIRRYWKETP